MKKNSLQTKLILLVSMLLTINSYSQVVSTNRNPVGLESNILFNAVNRYTVNQSGPALSLNSLFDGCFVPSYSPEGISASNPTIITLEGLPQWYHTQAGAWVGWTTRYWPARRFKIEGYETYYNNGWITIADYSNSDYDKFDFIISLSGIFTKLRFTFYEGTGDGGRFGISELFFIHPEASTPYSGLFEPAGFTWNKNGNDLNFTQGRVGIGTASPQNLLDVNGTIHAREVKVDLTGWSDFVFKPTYKLRTLPEIEQFIKTYGHLPEIPSAKEVEENGVSVGEMQAKLLQKIEELTLYTIEQEKAKAELKDKVQEQEKKIAELDQKLASQEQLVKKILSQLNK